MGDLEPNNESRKDRDDDSSILRKLYYHSVGRSRRAGVAVPLASRRSHGAGNRRSLVFVGVSLIKTSLALIEPMESDLARQVEYDMDEQGEPVRRHTAYTHS